MPCQYLQCCCHGIVIAKFTGLCEAQHQTGTNFMSSDQANQPEPKDPPIDITDYIHHHHVLLFLSLTADTHFIVPRRADG